MPQPCLGLVAATLVAMVLVAGCSSADGSMPQAERATSDPSGTIAPVQSGVVKVAAVDNNFKAGEITVEVGSKVVWTNAGRNDHNVTPVDGGGFGVEAKDFKPGAGYAATFTEPGTYHYYCTIHGTSDRGMVGTVQVVAP
jgi:plastocyanin